MNASRDGIGTRSWADRTRGVLSTRDQLSMAQSLVLGQLRGLPSQARALLRVRHVDASAIVQLAATPDNRHTREALAMAQEVYSPTLLNHCLRCWLWADLFARVDGVPYDGETLYLACILHDLGLTDRYRPTVAGPCRCFAVHGGEVAKQILGGLDAPARQAETVADAVALHMNASVPLNLGAEAHLLHAAAHLDVAGSRAGSISPETMYAVNSRHPRDGFATDFTRLMRREALQRPKSRAGLSWRLGIAAAIAANPLDRVTVRR